MPARILFVDDDEAGRALGQYNLTDAGHQVDQACDGQQALERFDAAVHDLVVTDLRMPRLSGMELLLQLKQQAPDVPVVVITAHGSVASAVEAMHAGAHTFIEKPFSRDVLLLAVGRALEHRRLSLENRSLRLRAAGVERQIVAASSAMEQLLQTVDRVARSEANLLITGESGTGKELVARRAHTRSARAEQPFVTVNCAAMPSELLESELFGHERGAYTGATHARRGRFRAAQGGTIFLDEVGEIPLPLQAKLLRAIQDKLVDVVGLDAPIQVDVRVLAATHRDLPRLVQQGDFREDLYYRLNVVELRVPALRERPEDIPPLVQHFVARAAPHRELVIPQQLMEQLRSRPWPGNVRELENACERLVVLCEGSTLSAQDLPLTDSGESGQLDPWSSWPELPAEGLSLVDLERRVIERVLQLKSGNVSQAAAYLKVPRHVLAYRIEKYGLRRQGGG